MDRNKALGTAAMDDFAVALRKESVDRNVAQNGIEAAAGGSLSARRAWIEIRGLAPGHARKAGRSPQGERG